MNFFLKVYSVTKKIPKGKVATYGQIAAICASPKAARQVGWALHALDAYDDHKGVPWQRVLNRNGMISTSCIDHPPEEQAHMLRKEGIDVQEREGNYFVDLQIFLWKAKNKPTRSASSV